MMLQVEPGLPPVTQELQTIGIRLSNLRTNLATLGDEFGIHLDQPAMPDTGGPCAVTVPGLDSLRIAITEINTQIAYLEQESERLFAARVQLFGLDSKWQTLNEPVCPPGQGPIQAGNFRSHP